LSTCRNLVYAAVITVLPSSLAAQESGGAMLHNNGGVLLNGNPAPPSMAIFPDDLVQTQPNAEATLDATGSTVTIKPEAIVHFEGNVLNLEHGTLLVSTSRAMTVRVGCITVIPVTAEWTQYDVADIDGKVTVNARKGDVNIEMREGKSQQSRQPSRSERVTVREGEQKTREEKCLVAPARPPEYVAGKGAILNSPWVKWPAVGVIATACWIICRSDDPVSPTLP
jgi:hypothetical protein